jgi:glycosyltransferase involved in cell wall biosynthesis
MTTSHEATATEQAPATGTPAEAAPVQVVEDKVTDVVPREPAPAAEPRRVVYIAGPCTPMGGGMYKVAEYLVQAQQPGAGRPELRLLETRGGGSALQSPRYLFKAIAEIVRSKRAGQLAGVHVNVAERLSLVRKGVLLTACRLLRVPVVLHLHAAQLHHNYREMTPPARALVRWVFSLADSCIVLGKGAAEFVMRELKVPPARVETVINGVPHPQVPRREVVPEVKQVLFLGNLSERKGVSDLLRALAHPALAKLPLQLTLAGGGDVDAYTALAHRLGLASRVHFHGWAGPQDVQRLLAQCDVLVLPSHDEGLPLAILEALAHGVPVVCSPVGEIPHVLSHGHSAVFVEPGDPASIARGLSLVLSEDQLRERLERNGRTLHEQQFSLTRFAANIGRIHDRHFAGAAVTPAEAGQQNPV